MQFLVSIGMEIGMLKDPGSLTLVCGNCTWICVGECMAPHQLEYHGKYCCCQCVWVSGDSWLSVVMHVDLH